MTPIAWLFISLVILPLSYLVWALVTTDRRAVAAIQTNLVHGFDQETATSIQRPPMLLDLSKRLTPTSYEAKLDRWLSLAGRPASLPLDRLVIAKPLLALTGAFLGLLMFAKAPSPQVIALGVFLSALLYFLPDLLIYNKGIKRQQEIELELPNTLDQLLISVEAGLGFEAAMARAGGHGGGALAQELMRTLQDIQVGLSLIHI